MVFMKTKRKGKGRTHIVEEWLTEGFYIHALGIEQNGGDACLCLVNERSELIEYGRLFKLGNGIVKLSFTLFKAELSFHARFY